MIDNARPSLISHPLNIRPHKKKRFILKIIRMPIKKKSDANSLIFDGAHQLQ